MIQRKPWRNSVLTHNLTQTSGNVTLNQQQLSELNAKLVEARTDVAQKKARVDILKAIQQKGGSLQSLPDLPASPQLTALRAQEAAASQKVAELSTRYNERHPLVLNARAELSDIQQAIATEMQRMAAGVENDYELAKAREEALEQNFRQATGQIDVDDRTAITLRELERTAAVNKNLVRRLSFTGEDHGGAVDVRSARRPRDHPRLAAGWRRVTRARVNS